MTFSAEGGNFFSAYKVRSKNDGFLGPYSPFLVGGSAQVTKGTEPLNPFCFAIKKRNLSKYSSALTKKERGKRKQCLFIEGALLCLLLFTFISYLSKQHKYNCLYKTNRVEKGMDR